MKDFVGREINVGDHVVHFTTKHKSCVATRDLVVGFTERMVTLQYSRACPENLVVYTPPIEASNLEEAIYDPNSKRRF